MNNVRRYQANDVTGILPPETFLVLASAYSAKERECEGLRNILRNLAAMPDLPHHLYTQVIAALHPASEGGEHE